MQEQKIEQYSSLDWFIPYLDARAENGAILELRLVDTSGLTFIAKDTPRAF